MAIALAFIEIPHFPHLRGQEAIDALNEIIKELEGQKSKEMTAKQAKALIKFANGLISAIQAEMMSEASMKSKPSGLSLFKRIERAFTQGFESFK